MAAQILLVLEKCFFYDFFYDYFFSKILGIKKINRTSISHLMVGCCQGTIRGCKSVVQV